MYITRLADPNPPKVMVRSGMRLHMDAAGRDWVAKAPSLY